MSSDLLSLSDTDLYKVLGITVKIKIRNVIDEIVGVIFSLLKEQGVLILVQGGESMSAVLVNLRELEYIQINEEQLKIDCKELLNLNIDRIIENEKRNLEKEILLQKKELVKDRVTPEEGNMTLSGDDKVHERCHAIYEKLSKIYKCSYDKDRITLIELDSYISEPYNLENIHCEDDYTRRRLVKLVEPCILPK